MQVNGINQIVFSSETEMDSTLDPLFSFKCDVFYLFFTSIGFALNKHK